MPLITYKAISLVPRLPARPACSQALIPTVVPGLVLGLLGLLGFIFFSLWSCAQCCGRRRGGKSGRPAAERAQFLAGFQEKARGGGEGRGGGVERWGGNGG